MKTKKSNRTSALRWAILPLLALAAPAVGCIVVDEDTCLEGEVICSGDYVQECYDDTWVIIEDCYDFCGGTCVYLADTGETACLC